MTLSSASGSSSEWEVTCCSRMHVETNMYMHVNIHVHVHTVFSTDFLLGSHRRDGDFIDLYMWNIQSKALYGRRYISY